VELRAADPQVPELEYMKTDLFSGSYEKICRKSHTVGQNVHHLEWCTKYRYDMFRKDKYKNALEAILQDIARENGMKVVSLTVASDHVHVVADLPFSMSQSKALQFFKGGTSYRLFRINEKFRRRYPRGHFWSPGKFARSVGDADLDTVVDYVKNHNINQTTLAGFGA
jgi:putative transposase